MAQVIKPKRSTVSGRIPTSSDLQDGEFAINIADKKIYINNGGSIVKVAEIPGGSGGGFITESEAIAFAIALGG